MKKIILLICLLGAFFKVSAANWYHFRSVSPSGHNLCYRIKSDSTVEVTHSDSVYGVSGNNPGRWIYNNSDYINHLVGDVIIPDTVASNNKVYIVIGVDNRAFWRCRKMNSVTLPSSIERIGGSAFDSCLSLNVITIPRNVKSIGVNMVIRCNNLDTINYLADSCVIGTNTSYVLGGKTPIKINIGNTVKYIPRGLFTNNSLIDSLILPSSVRYIANYAFSGCSSLTSLIIPENVTNIAFNTFRNCSSLTSIYLPSTLDSISHHAFYGCSALTSLVIPENVTKMGDYAFAGCVNLVSLTSLNPIPPQVYGDSTFHKVYKAIPLNVPSQSINTYKLAYGWRDFTNIVADTTIGFYQVTVTTVDTNMGQVKNVEDLPRNFIVFLF